MKLSENQVIIKNEETGEKFVYEIDKEDIPLFEKRGKKDEDGNIILSYPYVAVLKKWNVNTVLNGIEEYMIKLKVPEISKPKENEELLDISNYSECSNDELEKLLIQYGAFRGYLESQLSFIGSKKGVLEATFEEMLNKAIYLLSKEESEKRRTKEVLKGEALDKNSQLKKIRQDLIECEGLYTRINGLTISYKILWETVSRIISLRALERQI